MKPYKNLGGDSNVMAYDYGESYIWVQFKDSSKYEYTYYSAGASNVEQMKKLADRGEGLNSFINKNVRKKYSRKM